MPFPALDLQYKGPREIGRAHNLYKKQSVHKISGYNDCYKVNDKEKIALLELQSVPEIEYVIDEV